jgi:nicotinate-nucleotide pyrophosphorylase (carboxylating)
LAEDIGDGDHSTLSSIPADKMSRARLLVKADGILAGVEMAKHIFHRFDPSIKIEVKIQDGEAIKFGDVAFTVSGSARSILTTERLVLNCMQRMSGIATYTHRLAKMIAHTNTKLLDTRKTTPNFRIAEKWAVAIGGGTNHRYGLYDMVMLKDNHIDFAGGVKEAIRGTKAYLKEKGKGLRIEVETRNLKEVQEALEEGGIAVIMLDNMAPEMMREAVKIINGKCKTEASGGITETNIVTMAETGVDFVSLGALTHSAGSLDLSLKAF